MSDAGTNPLGALFGALNNGPRPRPDMRAQRMELRARFALYHAPRLRLRPGMLVEFKPGLGTIAAAVLDTHALMFWSWLRWWSAQHRAFLRVARQRGQAAGLEADCILAVVDSDNGGIDLFVANSRRLQPVAPP